MPRNLREKIAAIVNDAYDLRQESVITKLENLVKEELEMKDQDRVLTYHDLTVIRSMAVQEFTNMNMSPSAVGSRLAGDQETVRFLCIVNAVISFLRSKQLINFKFNYEKK
jgi:hypothetical protein